MIQTASGLCLDVKGGSLKDGATLQQWQCSQGVNQRFILQEAYNSSDLPKPFFLSFQSDATHKNNAKLEKMLKKWNWDYKIIGFGATWQNFGTKILGIIDFLKQLPDSNQIVVISDATDVLVNASPEDFIKNYLRLSEYNGTHRIVVSGEKACCEEPMNYVLPGGFILPDGTRKSRALHYRDKATAPPEIDNSGWKNMMKAIKDLEGYSKAPTKYDFLNAGMYAGRVEDLKRMYAYFNIIAQESDQPLLSEYLIRFPERIHVDYLNQLFSNANGWSGWNELKGCPFVWDEDKHHYINKDIESVPTLIQTPGKYWTCYNYLYSKYEQQ